MSSTKKTEQIPRKTIYRLSIYLRCLQKLSENDMDTVSSGALSKAAGVKSTQLRKDLAYFGQFGTRGLGYNVQALADTISGVLGSNALQPVILVGAGNLGSALLRYNGFRKEGFEIKVAFDHDDHIVGTKRMGVPVRPSSEMEAFIKKNNVKMAILAVPSEAAQEIANTLVNAGVQGILNFSPTVLQVPSDVVVNAVDLALELEHLSYFVQG
ncbi:MAG: redox-sensing transcriptional repressor Rex [Verrucomicrobiota bacterium]